MGQEELRQEQRRLTERSLALTERERLLTEMETRLTEREAGIERMISRQQRISDEQVTRPVHGHRRGHEDTAHYPDHHQKESGPDHEEETPKKQEKYPNEQHQDNQKG